MVLEQFQTDTADYADILLPATTFLEHTDLYLAYGHYYLQLARPALPAPGETKSNVEIFRLLAARMGFDDPCFRDIRRRHDPHAARFRASLRAAASRSKNSTASTSCGCGVRTGEPFLPFAEGGFGTPDGKCDFHAETLDYTPPVESRHGDARTARALSAGADFAQERRQHEFDLRQSRRRGPADRRRCTCNAADAAGARHSQRATRCASSTTAAPACWRAEVDDTRASRRGLRALGALGQARRRTTATSTP